MLSRKLACSSSSQCKNNSFPKDKQSFLFIGVFGLVFGVLGFIILEQFTSFLNWQGHFQFVFFYTCLGIVFGICLIQSSKTMLVRGILVVLEYAILQAVVLLTEYGNGKGVPALYIFVLFAEILFFYYIFLKALYFTKFSQISELDVVFFIGNLSSLLSCTTILARGVLPLPNFFLQVLIYGIHFLTFISTD